jgi:hypothetical protein
MSKTVFVPYCTSVACSFDIEGIHQFSNVCEQLQLKTKQETVRDMMEDVSFLKHPHRHKFHFTFSCQVNHDDRDVEFIRLGRLLKVQMLAKYPIVPDLYGCSYFGNKSCEMLAKEVIDIFNELYPDYEGLVECAVSEDGENEGRVYGMLSKELANG